MKDSGPNVIMLYGSKDHPERVDFHHPFSSMEKIPKRLRENLYTFNYVDNDDDLFSFNIVGSFKFNDHIWQDLWLQLKFF